MPELHSAFGYSAVSTFEQCPFKYKCQYIDGLRTTPTDDPANPLVIGTALHSAIETDIDTAIQEYFAHYPIITDQHIDEEIKLRHLIPKVKEVIPHGQHEVQVIDTNFIGTLDLLVAVDDLDIEEMDDICERCDINRHQQYCCYSFSGQCPKGHYDGYYDLYDFKYSNNVDRYVESRQLHLYKYYWEKKNPGKHIRNMYFVFVPKVQIRQKKTEDIFQFRQRLALELEKTTVKVVQVKYDTQKVIDHLELCQDISQMTEFSKNPTRLCDWCDLKKYCQEGDVTDMLPSTNRVSTTLGEHKKIWIYGQPFSGKTMLCDDAPTPLNLNTDGNVKNVTMARLPIKDTYEGRQKRLAWEVFKGAIDDLEAGSDFETVIVDLLEDTYESCRLYMYKQLGITHESDDSYRAWDKVRTEFLSTFRRLLNLPYNIVLISHEDTSKDLTKRGGDKVTAIKPNIQDKIANKIAGMVDIVIRAIKDGNDYVLSTKTSDVVFGGGRLTGMKAVEQSTSWDTIEELYGSVSVQKRAEKPKTDVVDIEPAQAENVSEKTAETSVGESAGDVATSGTMTSPSDETPKRRTRRTRN